MDPKLAKFRSIGTNLTAGAANTVYTCPANHFAKVELLFVANTAGGNQTVSIQWHDLTTGMDYYIVGGYIISAYGYLKIDGSYIVLNAGDYLVITPEAGSVMDASVSVEEYFNPMGSNYG